MTKTEAIELFGGKASYLARGVGCSRAYVSEWPEELPQKIADRVLGAHVRLTYLARNRRYSGKPIKA